MATFIMLMVVGIFLIIPVSGAILGIKGVMEAYHDHNWVHFWQEVVMLAVILLSGIAAIIVAAGVVATANF